MSWDKKLTKYSLLASAALTMLNACGKDEEEPNDPDISETDLIPDISLSSAINSVDARDFDLNNDGIMDLTVGIENFAQYGSDINISYIEAQNGSELLTQEETFTEFPGPFTDTVITPIAEGNTIGPSQVIWNDYFTLLGTSGTYFNQNIAFGLFFGQDKYVGVRIPIAGNTHYAWMRLGLTNDGSSVTVKEYAYRETPFEPINAGDK